MPTAISALKGNAKSAQRQFNNGREIRSIHLCNQFYLFFNVIPAPIRERIHFQKATAASALCVHYLGQVLLIAGFRGEAQAQLCWD